MQEQCGGDSLIYGSQTTMEGLAAGTEREEDAVAVAGGASRGAVAPEGGEVSMIGLPFKDQQPSSPDLHS